MFLRYNLLGSKFFLFINDSSFFSSFLSSLFFSSSLTIFFSSKSFPFSSLFKFFVSSPVFSSFSLLFKLFKFLFFKASSNLSAFFVFLDKSNIVFILLSFVSISSLLLPSVIFIFLSIFFPFFLSEGSPCNFAFSTDIFIVFK